MLDFFKKKNDDDLSEFTPMGKDESDSGSALPTTDSQHNNPFGDSHHLGLPSDHHSPSPVPQEFNMHDSPPSAPSSFDELNKGVPQQQQSPHPQESSKMASLEKDVALLGAKMDAVRAVLDSINNRLQNIERIAESSQKKDERVRW